ncbi:MAG: single-stranded-DNA-specific exonuclease RecJ [Dethiobacter sp.]|nr:MAG: single-stranded-DNA-specific exonuclease RecJ [Dethiobacter sp.]
MKKMTLEKERANKVWQLYPQDFEKRAFLAKELNIPLPVAQVLLNRGISSVEEGEVFLKPSLSRLHSPFSMKDMDRAVEVLFHSIHTGRRIAVYGDYDVDGITSTALLFSLLQQLGGEVTFYIPSRLQEGYGLNSGAIDYLKSQGVGTIVTVDCGISNAGEAAYARELGMEIVITDHHQPPEVLPDAAAVINPLRTDCSYPFKDLCGAGIAFKLGQALLTQKGDKNTIWNYLDLVALGTVADVVPLLGENRILVTQGLEQIEKTPRPGIKVLCESAGLNKKRLTAEDIAFIIAPRLNAAGRLGDPSRSFYLLLEGEEGRASRLAMELQKENNRRQALELKVLTEACAMAEEAVEKEKERRSFLLLAREGWHTGVLGIVASRMVERYNLPVILIALEKGIGKGSGRSTANFDLISALNQCSSLLLGFGGHRQAAGLTVTEECIPLLREKLNDLAGDFFGEEGPSVVFCADLQLEPGEITPELVRALEALEPFGFGNQRPVFYGEDWLLEKKREVGNQQQHLQLGLQKNNKYFSGISFNGKKKLPPLTLFREVDLVFSLSFDRWRGKENLQLEVYDCFFCDEHSGKNFTVIDGRGSDRKLRYVKNLLSLGETILIFVNTVARLQYLEKIFAGEPEIYFSHQGNFPSEISGIPKHVVIYDLPLSGTKLKELLSHLSRLIKKKGELHVHLIYNPRDYQDNLKLLRATVPAFCSLEQVYFSLQELAAGGNISLNSVYSKLGKMLPFANTKYLLQKSIELLQEASYLELNDQEIFLKHGSSDYCSLLKGIACIKGFRKERERWEQALSYQQFLLVAPGEEILCSLSDFTLGIT